MLLTSLKPLIELILSFINFLLMTFFLNSDSISTFLSGRHICGREWSFIISSISKCWRTPELSTFPTLLYINDLLSSTTNLIHSQLHIRPYNSTQTSSFYGHLSKMNWTIYVRQFPTILKWSAKNLVQFNMFNK